MTIVSFAQPVNALVFVLDGIMYATKSYACKRCHGRRRRFSVFTCHLKRDIDSRWETWFGTKSYRSHLDRKVSFERVADVLYLGESFGF